MYTNTIDSILQKVTKPARYIGNEYNIVIKDSDTDYVNFALAFPDIYEIGMSHLGLKILYHLLNERKDVYAQRVFSPWVDMEEELFKNKVPLFTLETKKPVKDCDFLGFTLQYELSYTNIINILKLSQITVNSNERTRDDPFVIAGGPCAYNPEPLVDFIDFFVIGEGEEIVNEIIDLYKSWDKADRNTFLEIVKDIQGVYVPKFYNVKYRPDNIIKSISVYSDKFNYPIKKRIIKDLDNTYYPKKVIIPNIEAVHDRAMLEIFRGCIRGCRFCQAGMIYRPVREKSYDVLANQAEQLIEETGYDELALTSLSTSDYSQLNQLTNKIISRMEDKKVNLSLPSLRIDNFGLNIAQKLQRVRKSSLTFAPEAGTQRLRDVINKGISEADIYKSAENAFKLGWDSVKLYFMIGLPSETYEDLDGIVDIVKNLKEVHKKENANKSRLKISVSVSSFVPKAFTPFQWEPQFQIEELKNRQDYLKSKLKTKNVKLSWNDKEMSFLEAVFARADRKVGSVILNAVEKGCKFDGWSEHFNYDLWMDAFKELAISPYFYANRLREYDEVLPWDHIDPLVKKSFLIREHEKSKRGELTKNCRMICSGCGANIGGDNQCL